MAKLRPNKFYEELVQWFRTAMPNDQFRIYVQDIFASLPWRLARAAYEAAVVTIEIERGRNPYTFHVTLTRTNRPASAIPDFDTTWMPNHLRDCWTGLPDAYQPVPTSRRQVRKAKKAAS